MVIVTERAKEELRAVVSEYVDEPGLSLRLVQNAPGQFGLAPDAEQEGDQVVEHAGLTVLLVEEELSALLESMIIDCRETPDGPQLVLARSA